MVSSKQFSPEKLCKICPAVLILVAILFALDPSNADCQTGTVHHYSSTSSTKLSPLLAQPIAGARVYWFTMGTNGYGSNPISMISPSANGAQIDANGNVYVLGDSHGNFSISSWIACPSPSAPMYVLSTQGDPGTGQNNPYIGIVAIIPTACGVRWSLDVTETSTVAAAYALNSFASVSTDSFATDSSSIPALQSAVAYSSALINTANGVIPSGSAWEQTLNTVADMLAGCVDSTGTTACTNLFTAATPPGGTAPADTFQAALDIASNPSSVLSGLYDAIPPSPPFQPILSSTWSTWVLPGSPIQITGITQPAPVGATITIAGAGFGSTQGSGVLVIGGVQASITSWSDTAILAVVPSGATAQGYAQVFQNGFGSNPFPFTVGPVPLPPTISQLLPSSGIIGTWVTISGSHFGLNPQAGTVTFNGTPSLVEIWSDTYLKVQVPDGATSGDVVVTVNLAASNGVPFTLITIGSGLVSLAVSPGSASMAAGSSQPYTAMATYSDGSTQDLTTAATWNTSDSTVAVVDSTGVATAIDNGLATVQATVGSITGSTTLTATPGPLDVVLTPVYPVNPTTGTYAFSGQKTIAIAPDGFARFAVVDSTASGLASGNYDDEVVYVRCLDLDCTTSHTTTMPMGHTMANYSMALAPNGYAKIANTYIGGVGLIECGDDDCSNSSNTHVDSNGDGFWVSVAVGGNGQAFVLYDKEATDGGDDAVNLATCSGGGCGIAKIADIPSYDNMGGAVTLGADGNPAVIYEDSGSWFDGTPDSVHYYAGGSDVVVSSNGSGSFWVQDIAIGPDGFARLAYVNNQGGVDFIQCKNATCGAWNTATIPSSGSSTEFVSVAVASDGTGVLQTSQVNSNNNEFWWDYIRCASADCSKYSDEIAPGSLAGHSLISLALDQNGEGHMILQAAPNGSGASGAVAKHARVGDECPTSVTLRNPTDIELDPWVSWFKTGLGTIAAMQVNPATNSSNGKNWNGTAITEQVQVIAGTNSCPGVVPVCGTAGQQAALTTFHVGCVSDTTACSAGSKPVQAWGKTFSQIDNVFNDVHMIRDRVDSELHLPGVTQTQCSMSCAQVYSCRNKPIGKFTIDFQLNRGNTNGGTPVTRVTVKKH